MATFPNLYDYQTENGIVIPQASDIKTLLENAFREIWNDISVDENTPIGRWIEATTVLFRGVLGVNAQNANNFNPNQAIGSALDALGKVFEVARLENQTDASYRRAILQSQSRGSGFAESIRSELSNVAGVTSICVLDNGLEDPQVLPNKEYGISVPGHSVFICVAGGSDADIYGAILKTNSAGCGYCRTEEYGTKQSGNLVTVESEDSHVCPVSFYRPSLIQFGISVTVNAFNYKGTDVDSDVASIIRNHLKDRTNTVEITKSDIISAVAIANIGVFCTDISFSIDGDDVESVTVRPFEYINPESETDLTVEVEMQ